MKIKLKNKYKKIKNICMKNPKIVFPTYNKRKDSVSLKMKKRKRKTLCFLFDIK